MVVGGECATVGPAGGFTQGGGHSALSSRFGLGADQVLEWEVVDGMGRLLTASPTQNPDLYWALSGGGGGTYGVVYAMTVKAFPDFPVTGVVLQFKNKNPSSHRFFEAIGHYHRHLPTYTAAGGMAIAQITNSSFLLTPLTLPAHTAVEAKKLLAPFLQDLHKLDISYTLNITESPSYFQHYMKLIEPNPTQLVQNAQYGGRLLPLDLIQHNNSQLTDAVEKITADGVTFVGIGLNVSSSVTGNIWNSVLPAWRTAAMTVILTTYVFRFLHAVQTLCFNMLADTHILQGLAQWCQPHGDESPGRPNDDQMGANPDSFESRFGVLYERGKARDIHDSQTTG